MRLAAPLAAALLVGLAPATSADSASLSARLANQQAREQQLRGQIASEDQSLGIVRGSLASVERQLSSIENDLAAKEARLEQVRTALRNARARLVQLELQLAQADRALAANLVSQFETDPPDAITVILQSNGFADMMDRLEFVRAAKEHDQAVITADRAARRRVVAAATALGALEVRQQALTTQIALRRDAVDRIRISLLGRSFALERARSAHAASLGRAEAQRRDLEAQLAALRPAAPAPGGPVGNVLSSGGFVFPMPAGAAVPPGSWSLDQGVDIAAAGGTPELAVCSGTIVLHGIGGFGPWAPVLHCDSPIAGYSYVYYGHAGPANQLPVGTHVGAGSVMSSVGPGIVGISTGPHLEIGFADAGGGPIGGGSASTMYSLLRAAY
jgi:murein DD-endopeptidase MepM/ murein hydrolase activator NlpD